MGLLSSMVVEGAEAEAAGSSLTKILEKVTGAVLGLGKQLVDGMGLKEFFAETEESESALVQMDSVLKSMGNASGMTKQQLLELAESQGRLTTFSKDSNIASENLLMTFNNIGSNVFPRALKCVNDMSQALGQDTKISATQLGQALNDPINGMKGLETAGITFTASQKQQIQTMQQAGNMAGAQNVILKELEKRYGGSAAAATNTFGGQLAILKNNLIGLNNEMSKGLMKSLTNFLKGINSFIESMGKVTPTTQKAASSFIAVAVSVGAILKGINGAKKGIASFGENISSFKSKIKGTLDSINRYSKSTKKIPTIFKTMISPIKSIFSKIKKEITSFLQKIIPNIAKSFASMSKKMLSGLGKMVKLGLKLVGPAALIAVVLAGLGLLQMQSGKKLDAMAKQLIAKGPKMIQQFTAKLVQQIPQLISAGTILLNNFIKVLTANAPALIRAAAALITSLVNGLLQNLPKIIPGVIKLIQTILQSIIQNLPTIIMAGLRIILALIQGITSNLPQIINSIVQVTLTMINTIAQHLPQIIQMGIKILGSLVEGISKAIPQLIAAMPQIILAIWNALKSVNWLQLGSEIINGIIQGIKAAVGGLFSSIKELATGVLKVAKGVLGIHSPSRVFKEEVGLFIPAGVAEGVEENTGGVVNSLNGMASKMVSSIGKNKGNIVDAAKGLVDMNFGMSMGMKLTSAAQSSGASALSPSGYKYNSLLHVDNLNIANDYDIEALANKLDFYMQKSKTAKGGR